MDLVFCIIVKQCVLCKMKTGFFASILKYGAYAKERRHQGYEMEVFYMHIYDEYHYRNKHG